MLNKFVEVKDLGVKEFPDTDLQLLQNQKEINHVLWFNKKSFLLMNGVLNVIVENLNRVFKNNSNKFNNLTNQTINEGKWRVVVEYPLLNLVKRFPILSKIADTHHFIDIHCNFVIDAENNITLRLQSSVPEHLENIIVATEYSELLNINVPITIGTLLGNQVAYADINVNICVEEDEAELEDTHHIEQTSVSAEKRYDDLISENQLLREKLNNFEMELNNLKKLAGNQNVKNTKISSSQQDNPTPEQFEKIVSNTRDIIQQLQKQAHVKQNHDEGLRNFFEVILFPKTKL